MTAPAQDTTGFPVQDTNILLVMRESLQREYPAVLARIDALEAEREALFRYRAWMERVADVGGIGLPNAVAADTL